MACVEIETFIGGLSVWGPTAACFSLLLDLADSDSSLQQPDNLDDLRCGR